MLARFKLRCLLKRSIYSRVQRVKKEKKKIGLSHFHWPAIINQGLASPRQIFLSPGRRQGRQRWNELVCVATTVTRFRPRIRASRAWKVLLASAEIQWAEIKRRVPVGASSYQRNSGPAWSSTLEFDSLVLAGNSISPVRRGGCWKRFSRTSRLARSANIWIRRTG